MRSPTRRVPDNRWLLPYLQRLGICYREAEVGCHAAWYDAQQEQARRDQLLRATAPGTRYIGTLESPVSGRSQRLRLTFGPQNGLAIQVEATNPDHPADRRSLPGEVVLAPQRNYAFAAQHPYPFQFTALAADHKSAPTNGQSWFCQRTGPVGLIPTEQGGLEGEAVVGEPYVIRLQREP